MQRIFRRGAFVGGILCLLVLLIPVYDHQESAEETRTAFQMGWPTSPWLRYEKTDFRSVTPTSSTRRFGSRYGIELLSWSSVFAVAGLGLFLIARRLRAPNKREES